MLKHKSNKLVFVLTSTIVLLLLFVLSIQVRPVVSQSISTQQTNEDFSGEANISQVPTAGTLVCNSVAATFDSGLPVDWSSVVTTGPVSWSTTDNTAVCDNGYEAGGTAPGACADADQTNNPPVAYDTELRTNSFDLIGLVNASLDLQWRHRPLNGSVFDIDVSTNGGSSWTNVLNNTTGNPSGSAGDFLSLDMSPFIGNSSVMARFRFYGVDWDWYVHLDDIRLSCEVPPPPENCTFGQWTPIASLNTARSRTGAAYSDVTGRFYVLGGEATGSNRDIPIEEYDVVNNVWIDKSLLNTGISNSGAAAVGDYIYVPGGYNGSAQDVMQRYDPVADSVTIMSPMPSANFAHAVTALGTDIYVLGGSITGTVGTTNFIYDTISDSWSSGAPLPIPTQYPAATTDGTYVYVLGGATSDLNDVQRYDPSTDTWTTLTGMNVGRGGPGAFFDGVNIWAVAGGWSSYLTNTEYGGGAPWTSGSFVNAGARTIGVAYNGSDVALKAGGWAGAYVDAAETISIACEVPEIVVDPTSIADDLFAGMITTYPMSISNMGTGTLDWSISETVDFIGQAIPTTIPVANQAAVGAALTDYDVNELPQPMSPDELTPLNGPASVSGSGFTYYADRPTFEAANPGLPVEDFEEGNVGAGGVLGCDAPLYTNTTGGTCFAVGDILPGIFFQDDVGPDAGGLVILGAGFNGNPNISLLANTYVDSFDIYFTQPTNAVGMDLQSHFNPDTVNITIYAIDGTTVIGNVTASSTNAGSFWGVSADQPIGRIKIYSPTDQAEGVDNIAFGYTLPCDVSAIPWASVNPTSGSISSGSASEATVTFDSTGLAVGVYTGTLCVNSNDPVSPVVYVPLTMTVKELPDITIISPVNDTVLTGPSATVEVTITNDFMIPEDGHWHILVDGNDAGPVMGYSGVVNLSPGTHELTAQLQAPDHTPLGPEDTIVVHVIAKLYLPTVKYNAVSYFVGPEQEPNDSSGQANGPLEPGQAYTGFPDDDRDYFSFVVNVPGNINVALSNYTGQGGQLQLFYQSTANRVGFDTEPPYNIAYQGQPGTYFVLIFTESGFNNTPYSLVVNTP